MVELIGQRLLSQFTDFPEVKPWIESTAFGMHHGWARSVITEKLTGDRLLWKPVFAAGPPLFEGGRVWGVLVVISAWFKERRLMITVGWDDSMAGGAGERAR